MLPFFSLRRNGGSEGIEYTKVVRREGGIQRMHWRVRPHPEYGTAGPFAHRVHRAVEQLITERGLPTANPVPFTVHDLCRRLGLRAGGTEYRKVREALISIKATQVESEGAFYAKSQSRYIDQVFSLYDRIVFAGEQLPDGRTAETNLLYLGTWYLENLNSLYVKPLDYRLYSALRTPIARRLYELLGVKFYRVWRKSDPWIRYRYSTLCKILPMKQHLYRSLVRQQLEAPHAELLESQFLLTATIRPISHARDWHVTYRPGRKAIAEIEETRRRKKNLSICRASS